MAQQHHFPFPFFFFEAIGQMETPYLNLIAYPAIYPFWLIPVQLKTSRHHIFFCPSWAISVISKPKSGKENGCGACDVQDPRRHLHEVRGRSWLCMVEEVVVPLHCILCSWCTGLSHWIRGPTARPDDGDSSPVCPRSTRSSSTPRWQSDVRIRAGLKGLAFIGMDGVLSFSNADSQVQSARPPCLLTSAISQLSFPRMAHLPTPQLCPNSLPSSLHADLFHNKTRWIQGQPLWCRRRDSSAQIRYWYWSLATMEKEMARGARQRNGGGLKWWTGTTLLKSFLNNHR